MAVLITLISLAFLACAVEVQGVENFTANIKFFIYPATGPKVEYTSANTAVSAGCNVTGQWAYIIHGWRESTNFTISPWVGDMVSNLTVARGGCIIAMDYSYYASNNLYPMLVSQFEGIAAVLLANVQKLLAEGFSINNGYMFGFSYGVHLTYSVGATLGGNIPRIDSCEPAMEGFDGTSREKDPKLSAKNVQCVDTSYDAGTTKRICHQNWIMGDCGFSQPAAPFMVPFGSHVLCPPIFNSAFKNNFYAVPKASTCVLNLGTVATGYPANLRMGYMDSVRLATVRGSLFAKTYNTKNYAAP